MAFDAKNQKIFMVTGKGGVGKSVVAAALAQKAAKSGLKTLLVELGEQSFFQYVYHRPVVYEPTPVAPYLSVALWGGESCLREYVYYLLKIKTVVDLFFDNRVMRTFVRAAPALKELAILGKLTSGIRNWGPEMPYDLIVVDAFSTGHFQALMSAPRGMSELIEAGPMGEQSRNIIRVLESPDHLKYFVVTLPEELPVSEACEQIADLKKSFHAEAQLILNRFYSPQIAQEELLRLREGQQDPGAQKFIEFLYNLQQRQAEQLAVLEKEQVGYQLLPWVLHFDTATVIQHLEEGLPE